MFSFKPCHILGVTFGFSRESLYLGFFAASHFGSKTRGLKGPGNHVNRRILRSGFNSKRKGIPETMASRILRLFEPLECKKTTFIKDSWSFGPLIGRGPKDRGAPSFLN